MVTHSRPNVNISALPPLYCLYHALLSFQITSVDYTTKNRIVGSKYTLLNFN